MANNIELFKQYLPILDEVYKGACVTSVLDGSPEFAHLCNNANEFVVWKMGMSGLANYSRSDGYVGGDVTLTTETMKCNYDRGRMFTVDTLDDIETAAIAFGRLSGEFIRTRVAPELDAFRFSAYYATDGVGKKLASLTSGSAVITALRQAHTALDDAEVPRENRILFINANLKNMVDDMDTTASRASLELASQVIVVPQTRFYTKIDMRDGTTGGQEEGGFAKNETGKNLNFMLVHKDAVIQFQKHVVPKVIPPEQNPDADAWKFGYRTVGIASVFENKAAGIYCHAGAE